MANNPDPQPAANKTTAPSQPPTFEFVVEMADRRNNNFIWPLDKRSLRGRWTKVNLAGVSMDEKFAHMPDIPGICLHVNTRKKTAFFFDPLADEKNKRLLEKACAVLEESFGTKHAPDTVMRLEGMSDDDLKSFCYWTRRFLDNRQCRVEHGTVPTMDEIEAMSGMISWENHDTSADVQKLKERAPRRYKPVAHEEEIDAFT